MLRPEVFATASPVRHPAPFARDDEPGTRLEIPALNALPAEPSAGTRPSRWLAPLPGRVAIGVVPSFLDIARCSVDYVGDLTIVQKKSTTRSMLYDC
jgi:hypothetical protein